MTFLKCNHIVVVNYGSFTYNANFMIPIGFRPNLHGYTYSVCKNVNPQEYVHIRFFSSGSIEVRRGTDAIVTTYTLFGTGCWMI